MPAKASKNYTKKIMNKIPKYLALFICLFCAVLSNGYAQTQTPDEAPPAIQNAPTGPSSLPIPSPPPSPFPYEGQQNPQEGDPFFHQLLNMAFSLGTILVVILLVSYVLKRILNTRIQQLNTNSLIKIIERRSLTPKTAIYVLEINDQHIVIAESVNGVTLLNPHGIEKLSTASDFEKVLHEKTP